jgi:hypothetical protein
MAVLASNNINIGTLAEHHPTCPASSYQGHRPFRQTSKRRYLHLYPDTFYLPGMGFA